MISVKAIEDLLPQTQCGECGYSGCRPYAEALATGKALINRCPPGGVSTVKTLAALLGVDARPYLAEAEINTRPPSLAFIVEQECIGCKKCINACPVDAIVGSGKLMHSVLEHECTGCGLCLPACPMDCIEMHPISKANFDKSRARERFNAKEKRLQAKRQSPIINNAVSTPDKKSYILEALARVRAKKK